MLGGDFDVLSDAHDLASPDPQSQSCLLVEFARVRTYHDLKAGP